MSEPRRPEAASAVPPGAQAARLRRDAEGAASALPPLLLAAERLASLVTGAHGRRRSGRGETFWQYRRALPGDALSDMDWRRSARADELYVRETEWEAAQTLWLWPDRSAAMRFRSKTAPATKAERAALLALALAALAARSGERFALLDPPLPPTSREPGLRRMALALAATDQETPPDYGAPPAAPLGRRARVVLFSDFFGPLEPLARRLASAAAQEAGGALVQILDPAEEAFPYRGRLLFESMGGLLNYEADRAESLDAAYRGRLAERRARLEDMARGAGWRLFLHRTDQSPAPLLLALHGALSAASHSWSAPR